MRTTRIVMALAVALAVAPALAGCAEDNDDMLLPNTLPGLNPGTFVQSWTIEGTRSPEKCTQYGADRLRVILFDDSGDENARQFAPCASFEMRVTLRPTSFTGTATFVDASGEAVSETLRVQTFTLLHGGTVTAELNFSAGAMTIDEGEPVVPVSLRP